MCAKPTAPTGISIVPSPGQRQLFFTEAHRLPTLPLRLLGLSDCLDLSPFPGRLGGGDERGGELLVEGEEVFDAVPVAGERLGPVTAVHRAVQLLVRLEQRRGHRQRAIQISQHRGRVLRPRVQHRLRRRGKSFSCKASSLSSSATIRLASSSQLSWRSHPLRSPCWQFLPGTELKLVSGAWPDNLVTHPAGAHPPQFAFLRRGLGHDFRRLLPPNNENKQKGSTC